MGTVLLPIVLLGFMYVLLIRPQQQRARRQRMLVSSLAVGDRIVTIGGIMGEIVALDDETAEIRVNDGVVITFVRAAINRKVEPDMDAAAGERPDVPEAEA